MKKLLGIAAIAILSVSCAHNSMTYVGMANEGQSFVKTVTPKDVECKSVSVEMTNRSFSELQLEKIRFDDATICQASLPKDTAVVRSTNGIINIPTSPQKIVIMGDTGCRLRNQNGKGPIQNCDDDKEWPFSRLMRSAEKENADLIIHVGDYHYRESCTDPVKCKNFQGTLGYGYKPWAADFLTPAGNVLRQKPWIFGRGNHEDCNRAHEGFNKLLSPVGEEACVDAQETRYTSFGDFLIVNFDNASVDDKPIEMKSEAGKALRARYKKMVETIDARPEKEVWLIIHRPIWGLAPSWSGPGVSPVNINMEAIVRELPLPKKVKMVYAGHIHAFQIAQGNHPPEMIIGESGTALDYFSAEAMKLVPAGHTVFPADHGYALLEKDVNGKWKASIKSYDGETDFVCRISEPGIPCQIFK